MTTSGLSDVQAARLMVLVTKRLREAQLEAPRAEEREPVYTARALTPRVREALEELGIVGLVEAGDGAGAVRPVPLFGLLFYPDLTVAFHGIRTLAFEVKFVGHSGRQNSIATCLGQAYLYRQAGYQQAGALLIDLVGRMSDEEIKQAETICRSAAIEVVVRRKAAHDLLAEHPR